MHKDSRAGGQAFNQVTLSSRVSALSFWSVCMLHTLTLKAIHCLKSASSTNLNQTVIKTVNLSICLIIASHIVIAVFSIIASFLISYSPTPCLFLPHVCPAFFQVTVSLWERTMCSGSTTQNRPELKGRRHHPLKPPWSRWIGPLLRESCWRSRALT